MRGRLASWAAGPSAAALPISRRGPAAAACERHSSARQQACPPLRRRVSRHSLRMLCFGEQFMHVGYRRAVNGSGKGQPANPVRATPSYAAIIGKACAIRRSFYPNLAHAPLCTTSSQPALVGAGAGRGQGLTRKAGRPDPLHRRCPQMPAWQGCNQPPCRVPQQSGQGAAHPLPAQRPPL